MIDMVFEFQIDHRTEKQKNWVRVIGAAKQGGRY